jgi:uncharacterized membrane protein YkvI
MMKIIQRYFVPGLVIQAVLVGGAYSTGRELVEFFLNMGPASALLAMAFTAVIFSAASIILFELARRHRCYEYNAVMGLLLGRLRILFELGYLTGLMLVLAIASAATAELLNSLLDWPAWVSISLYMTLVVALVFFGNAVIERVISIWSLLFYATYAALFILVAMRFSDQLGAAMAAAPLRPLDSALNSITYTAYNMTALPVLIFVARHFETRREAIVAGALAGPLILLPGFVFLLSLSAFYPEINAATLPIQVILDRVGSPAMAWLVQIVILGALIKTGAGLLHGFNERLAWTSSGSTPSLSSSQRSLVSLVIMLIAIVGATQVGLIDLVGKGYRYSAVYNIAVLLIPIFTIGLYRVLCERES